MKIYTNIIQMFTFLCMALFILGSCNDDGDTIYLSTPESEELIAGTDKAVLLPEIAQQVILSLSWTKSTLSISNPEMGVPDGLLLTYVEASTDEAFTSIVESQESSLSKAYTVAELNTLARNLGMEPEVERTIYFRLGAASGTNMDRIYSNTVAVNVTPYLIDMSFAKMLDTNEEDTGIRLTSPKENGIYTGFVGATSWYNFFLLEGDGTLWGNDGVLETAFTASSSDEEGARWNFWYPGTSGCYYTIVDTQNKEWSALLLPTLNITGDLNGQMEYDRPNNRWTYVFNASSTSSLNIQLSTTGEQYNVSTTADGPAIETPVAFVQEGDKLGIASQPGTISVTVPATGESTLIVDLSDPDNWTCKVSSGAEIIEETPEYLYLPGIDDLISGSWTFDNFLMLYDEDNLAYAGVVNVDSEWGYSINIEKDNWDDKYTLEDGDGYAGTLVYQGADNLPAPDAGVYLMNVSIKALTYELTALSDEIYLSGLNDNWDEPFTKILYATDEPGVYSGEIVITEVSEWGFGIYLQNNWNYMYGGSDGQLYYQGSNITADAEAGPGTYTMTVDLINGTYRLE